jgi:GNAT superfamily N-acetyltransferase
MPAAGPPALRIEPLDPARHDRAAFSCGVAQVDNFFQKTANKLAQAGNLRVYVAVAPDGGLVGFYAINAHTVAYADLPPRYARTRPAHGSIPAAFIAMIGRDRRYTGQGHGATLLVDALQRIAAAADLLEIAVAMLDVLDCGDPDRVARRLAMYQGFGFQPLPSQPMRLFLPVATVRALVAEVDGGAG